MTTPKRNEAVAKVRSDLELAVEVLRNVGGQSAIANTVEAGAQAIAALQGEVSRLREALSVLSDACFAEFCSKKTERFEPDDSKVSYPEETCHITFGMIRNARKALNLEPPTDGR